MANKYGPKIVTDGLVLCLDFSDIKSYSGSGDIVYDRSGNNYNYALTNSPVFTSNYKGGLTFDGTDTFCRGGLPVSEINETFSICVWFSNNGNGTNPSTANRIISADRINGSTKFCIGINSSGNFQVAGAGGSDGEPDFSITNGIPYYICYISNGTTSYSLFINDIKELTNESYSVDTGEVDELSIGCRPNTTDRVFNGIIYTVNIYNKALTDSEALQNYNSTKGRFGL